ncbi:NTP transferase domain-containing protein [bacterium]|jgi:UDP-N-acetylglucosamine diphosphorylase / glucose-1-phosphate thymidylyltransferase / UDP-N-acetylgalactosamine diphosphorylase / glucosamine-1-phosphate N-acetyltransferase / galactosamine-1-phosphate N-acetyltransferase|nr:NTP transferase domain-containing protein [bacterium]MBT4121576.1 NTP transferase domain-containing protein [bacterium]MBT4495383.1 NTP transferase domain-containing protein [bacterium]MBT4763608.1 NTP transferase domain-containing protein [bacterium]MBT5400980.1 NTP transferase domain-containing protein [bacterium]
MIKKVVVAAAGRGTRMLHLSANKPKHLIKVNGKPFLYYLMNNLKKAGLTEIYMIIGYKKRMIEKFLTEYKDEFNITVINQFDELGDKYGTACPIECVKDLIKENFISVNGDNLYSVHDLKRMMIDDDFNYIAGIKVQDPQKYGVLIRDGDDYLDSINEKPENYVGNLINTGLFKLTPNVFSKLPDLKKSSRDEYEFTDIITMLAQEKKVKIKEIADYWLDLGKPSDVKKIEYFLNNNK